MTATAVAVLLALFWLAPWTRPLPFRWPSAADTPSADAPSSGGTTSLFPSGPAHTAALDPQASPPASSPPAAVIPAVPPSAPPARTAGSPVAEGPAFDIVRVEPTGDAVVAGRSDPGATVTLMDGDKVIARTQADGNGQFAIVPPTLGEGSHYLMLQAQTSGQSPSRSVQGVAVSVSRDGSKPLVALLSPDKPAQVLSAGEAPAAAGGASAPDATGKPGSKAITSPAAAAPVAIQTVEAAQGGKFLASGVAHPGSQCRVYLNGAFLADVTADPSGRWSVQVQKGMKPGRYTVRADELEAGSGKVTHRAEVPFDYPETMTAAGEPGGGRRQLMARSAAPQTAPATVADASAAPAPSPTGTATASEAVIPSLQSATVIRGDSLWRISRKMLGHGIHYTEIYASNLGQIRNPALIYPGQIFVVPSRKAGAAPSP